MRVGHCFLRQRSVAMLALALASVGTTDDQRDGLISQFDSARVLARTRGFANVTYAIVATENHNPMPSLIFAYFDSLRRGP